MGMFDSFYDQNNREWQTKAFDCNLGEWRIGDAFDSEVPTFQVEVLGGIRLDDFRTSHVTIRDGVVEAVDVPQDSHLLLVAYSGGVIHVPGQDGAR